MVMSKSAYPAYQVMHRQCSSTIAVTVNCAPGFVGCGGDIANRTLAGADRTRWSDPRPYQMPPLILDGRIDQSLFFKVV
jgi:hypothetical protein